MSSVRIRQAPPADTHQPDMISKPCAPGFARPVGRKDPRIRLTSFREIISVVDRSRVCAATGSPQGGANDDVVRVKYTNQKSSFLGTEAGKVHAFWSKEGPARAQKVAWAARRTVFLLPDQIKRDKGVWWMPWQ